MGEVTEFQSRVRVGGSAFTIFTFGGQPITFCQQVSYTSPQAVGGGMEPIQPMDEPYPIEIVTPAAAGPGQVVLNMFELFGSGGVASKVWDRLGLNLGVAGGKGPFGQSSFANASTQFKVTGEGVGGLFAGAADIVDIFVRQAQANPHEMQIVKIIRPLQTQSKIAGQPAQVYTEEYNGCVITQVQDGEQIAVGTMAILKQITVNFRYVTRNGKESVGFAIRNNPLSH